MVWYGIVYCTGAEPGSLHPAVYAVPRKTIKETFVYCLLSCGYPVNVHVARNKVLNVLMCSVHRPSSLSAVARRRLRQSLLWLDTEADSACVCVCVCVYVCVCVCVRARARVS
jgi:hypothetical protein